MYKLGLNSYENNMWCSDTFYNGWAGEGAGQFWGGG